MALERIGPYRIIRLLGKGGMGAVYEGLHEAIERRVAIKVLHAELGRRSDIATRFINEARAVNRIDHPGLVQVSDYGQLPDGMAYIVMEYLKGETLGQRLKRLGTRLPAADVIRLGRQLCTALAAAHEKEIVHRDLKPDNIMITPNVDVPGGEQIKILDFGIAKLTETETGTSEAHTRADALLGTPRYMSPEQCRGGASLDAKSDVYSLGVRADRQRARRPSGHPAQRHTERYKRWHPPGGKRGGRQITPRWPRGRRPEVALSRACHPYARTRPCHLRSCEKRDLRRGRGTRRCRSGRGC